MSIPFRRSVSLFGNDPELKSYLKRFPDVVYERHNGMTLLMVACKEKDLLATKALLAAGSDPAADGPELAGQQTDPLFFCYYGVQRDERKELVVALLKHGFERMNILRVRGYLEALEKMELDELCQQCYPRMSSFVMV